MSFCMITGLGCLAGLLMRMTAPTTEEVLPAPARQEEPAPEKDANTTAPFPPELSRREVPSPVIETPQSPAPVSTPQEVSAPLPADATPTQVGTGVPQPITELHTAILTSDIEKATDTRTALSLAIEQQYPPLVKLLVDHETDANAKISFYDSETE